MGSSYGILISVSPSISWPLCHPAAGFDLGFFLWDGNTCEPRDAGGPSGEVGDPPWPADAQAVQEPLRHKDVKTTMVYTYVMNCGGRGVPRRLDRVQQVLPVESWRIIRTEWSA